MILEGKAGKFIMCSEKNRSCCAGECAGHCRNSDVDESNMDLNAIVELEIHYSESKETDYIFEGLYSITNTQIKESKLTGLEGNKYDSLEIMKAEIFSCSSCELYKAADVSYIREDV